MRTDELDSYSLYMREVEKYPLLTFEEERKLGYDLLLRDSIKIFKKKSFMPDIDMLLASCKTNEDANNLIKMINDIFNNNGNNVFSCNGSNILSKINEYSELYETIGRVPNTKELSAFFKKDYSKVRKIDNSLIVPQLEYFATYYNAKNKLINHNQLYIVNYVLKNMRTDTPFTLLDVIDQANIGLMRAIDRYDVTQGYKFLTYATWWIKQTVTRYFMDEGRDIRIPVHLYDFKNKVSAIEADLTKTLERKPTEQEIAEAGNFSLEKIKSLDQFKKNTVSLELPVGDEEDTTLGDFLEDEYYVNPEQHAVDAALRSTIDKALEVLTPKEREILKLRYGMDDNDPKTLDEVGKMYNLTRERIRQINEKALKKIRTYDRLNGSALSVYHNE